MRVRPLARREASTALPPRVAIRARKPCFFARLRTLGWNVRFDIKLSLRLSGISPKGFGLLGHNWWVTILLGKTAMRELGYGHLLIRVKPEEPGFFGLNPLSMVLVGFGTFVDNHLQFLRIAPTFALYPQKSGPKGSSFTLDHRLWITLWTSRF